MNFQSRCPLISEKNHKRDKNSNIARCEVGPTLCYLFFCCHKKSKIKRKMKIDIKWLITKKKKKKCRHLFEVCFLDINYFFYHFSFPFSIFHFSIVPLSKKLKYHKWTLKRLGIIIKELLRIRVIRQKSNSALFTYIFFSHLNHE
jgi:hypothetical protein